jgi:predicted secreted acid phosphatase
MRLTLLLALLVGSASCTTGASTAPVPPGPPSLADAKRHCSEYVGSGRYDAEVAAVVEQARGFLESRAARGGKLALVLDIDETALSNLPNLRANDYGFIVGGPCDALPNGPGGFVAWVALVRAEPIKPVLALARLARERGVAVFFLTGRPERLRAATERNLRSAGFEWTGVILKPDAMRTSSAMEQKAAERKKLVEPNPFYLVP